MTHLNAPVARRSARALALTPLVLLPFTPGVVHAVPPEAWPVAEPVGALDFLMVLLVIPLAVIVAVTLLSSVPSLVRGQKYTPGLAWRNENEWFGGPKDGLGAADRTDPASVAEDSSERGGASARW